MRKFIIKLLLWIVPIVAVHLFIAFRYTDGNTDDNYRHFAVPKPTDIILGDSRGSQAMVPEELNSILKGHQFDNFSLNITHSPYGPVYFEALKKKLNPNTKNGIFILTVDPWNVSLDKKMTTLAGFNEGNSPLADMHFYDIQPNIEYLLKHYPNTWYYIYRDNEKVGKSNSYLHKDGWMEINVSREPEEMAKRVKEKVEFYSGFAKTQQISEERLQAFKNIIDFLKPHGKVYIVRIPGGTQLMEIEKKYAPQFDDLMREIAKEKGAVYFDFSKQPEKYEYTDGNHMYKDFSRIFSRQVADSIKAR